jgi:hypothetical protein
MIFLCPQIGNDRLKMREQGNFFVLQLTYSSGIVPCSNLVFSERLMRLLISISSPVPYIPRAENRVKKPICTSHMYETLIYHYHIGPLTVPPGSPRLTCSSPFLWDKEAAPSLFLSIFIVHPLWLIPDGQIGHMRARGWANSAGIKTPWQEG